MTQESNLHLKKFRGLQIKNNFETIDLEKYSLVLGYDLIPNTFILKMK